MENKEYIEYLLSIVRFLEEFSDRSSLEAARDSATQWNKEHSGDDSPGSYDVAESLAGGAIRIWDEGKKC